MGGAATSRERQAALRAGRRKDGLKYIHIWANPDQEQAIKAYLGDAQDKPLHVTRGAESDELEEEVRRLQENALEDASIVVHAKGEMECIGQ